MRRNPTVSTDLYFAVCFAGCPDHHDSLVDGMACRFLNVNVGTGFTSSNRNEGVPVVGCGVDNDFRFLFIEHFAVIVVRFWF